MRKRRAHLVSVKQETLQMPPDMVLKQMWVATDSAGRRFIGSTEKEATQMLEDYNKERS